MGEETIEMIGQVHGIRTGKAANELGLYVSGFGELLKDF